MVRQATTWSLLAAAATLLWSAVGTPYALATCGDYVMFSGTGGVDASRAAHLAPAAIDHGPVVPGPVCQGCGRGPLQESPATTMQPKQREQGTALALMEASQPGSPDHQRISEPLANAAEGYRQKIKRPPRG